MNYTGNKSYLNVLKCHVTKMFHSKNGMLYSRMLRLFLNNTSSNASEFLRFTSCALTISCQSYLFVAYKYSHAEEVIKSC